MYITDISCVNNVTERHHEKRKVKNTMPPSDHHNHHQYKQIHSLSHVTCLPRDIKSFAIHQTLFLYNFYQLVSPKRNIPFDI